MDNICTVLDTLVLARKMHPGQKNNLDALCKRYDIDNSQRDLHGALLDAEILAETYLAMTGGQTALSLGGNNDSLSGDIKISTPRMVDPSLGELKVIRASEEEIISHNDRLASINEMSDGECVWLKNEQIK